MCCMREEPIFNKKGKIKKYTKTLTFMKWMQFFFLKVWYQKRILWGMVACAINPSTGESESVCLCAWKAAWIIWYISGQSGLLSVLLSLKKLFHSVLNIYFCNLLYYLSAMATWFLKYLMYYLRAKNFQMRLWSFCEIIEMETLLSIGICKKWRVRFPSDSDCWDLQEADWKLLEII